MLYTFFVNSKTSKRNREERGCKKKMDKEKKMWKVGERVWSGYVQEKCGTLWELEREENKGKF